MDDDPSGIKKFSALKFLLSISFIFSVLLASHFSGQDHSYIYGSYPLVASLIEAELDEDRTLSSHKDEMILRRLQTLGTPKQERARTIGSEQFLFQKPVLEFSLIGRRFEKRIAHLEQTPKYLFHRVLLI